MSEEADCDLYSHCFSRKEKMLSSSGREGGFIREVIEGVRLILNPGRWMGGPS